MSVRRTRASPSRWYSPALVEHAEQARLDLVRELAELVEEEGRAVGLAHEALALGRAGVRIPAEVPEELRVGDPLGDGDRAPRDHRLLAALRQGVDGLRHDLLAGAARAEDEHVGRACCHEGDVLPELPGERALSDDPEPVGFSEAKIGREGLAEARENGGPLDAEERDLTFDLARLARREGERVHGLPARVEELSTPEVLHEHDLAVAHDLALATRDRRRVERRASFVLPWALAHERGELVLVGLAPEDFRSLGREEQVTHAARVVRVHDHEREPRPGGALLRGGRGLVDGLAHHVYTTPGARAVRLGPGLAK
jgi:hypothetical protein